MNQRSSILFLLLLSVLAACGQSSHSGGMDGMAHSATATSAATSAPTTGSATAPLTTTAPLTDTSTMPGMDHGSMPMAMTDLEFLDGMVVHHQGAITMATEALTQASRPEVKALAQTIIDAQGPEIAQLRAWREAWYAGAPATDPAMLASMHMGAMTVPANGPGTYDERFLMAMISHHRGAVQMAESIQATTTRKELKAFAATVIADQTAEIQQMESWVGLPPGGMDHSGMPDMSGMNHGSMPMSDLEFLDGMVVHHQGAITMATEALTQATRPEVMDLAQQIIDAQGPEIAQLRAWREAWYAGAPATPQSVMDRMGMGDMTVPADGPGTYDERFVQAMMSHHIGAVEMASAIKDQTTHPELKAFAEQVIADQTAEIKLMEQWLIDWRKQ